MTDATTNQMSQVSAPVREEQTSTSRSQRVTAVAWLTGITAVVALGTISGNESFGAGLGVIGIAGMVTAVCYLILRER